MVILFEHGNWLMICPEGYEDESLWVTRTDARDLYGLEC